MRCLAGDPGLEIPVSRFEIKIAKLAGSWKDLGLGKKSMSLIKSFVLDRHSKPFRRVH